jgi:hypothetical protein
VAICAVAASVLPMVANAVAAGSGLNEGLPDRLPNSLSYNRIGKFIWSQPGCVRPTKGQQALSEANAMLRRGNMPELGSADVAGCTVA